MTKTTEEIRAFLNKTGMSNRELAERAGMDENKLTKALAVPRPDSKTKPRRIQVAEMAAIERVMASDATADSQGDGGGKIRTIPHLGKVPGGRFRAAMQTEGARMAVSEPDTPPNAYALTVEGHSMDLIADDGTTLVIDPDDIDLWDGQRYIIMTEDGETTFKEYAENPARLIPCSSLDGDEELPLGALPIKVLGRVFSYSTRDMRRRVRR